MELNWNQTKQRSLLLAVLVTMAAFLIARIAVSTGSEKPYVEKAINASDTSRVEVCGDRVYYMEDSSLHCVDSDGDYVWNMSVDYESDYTVTSHGVAVWSGSRVRIVNVQTGKVEATISGDSTALYGIIGDAYAAAVFGPEDDATVVITDLLGNHQDTITGLDELTVLDCGFFEGRSLFWLMTLDASGSEPTCTISTYKPGHSNTGTIVDMDQVIYKVMFRSSYICAVGTNYMKLYNYIGEEQESMRRTVYGWVLQSVASGSEEPLMVFAASAECGFGTLMQDLRLIRGDEESMLHFPVGCSSVAASGNTVYGFGENVLCVGRFGDSTVKNFSMPVQASAVAGVTEDLTAVVTDSSCIYLVKLPSLG